MTGQLVWDYRHRTVLLLGPKTQAIVGFAGGRSYTLGGVEVELKTPFVSLLFTPLDDRDLSESTHVLITAMARDKQTGTRYDKDGNTLLEVGGPPLLMEPVQARIRIAGPAPKTVRAVDLYGVPTEREVPAEDGWFTIDGRYETYYYEVRR